MSQSTINEAGTEQATWHLVPGAEALARLNSTPTGLTDAEAAERLVGYGPNALQPSSRSSSSRSTNPSPA